MCGEADVDSDDTFNVRLRVLGKGLVGVGDKAFHAADVIHKNFEIEATKGFDEGVEIQQWSGSCQSVGDEQADFTRGIVAVECFFDFLEL